MAQLLLLRFDLVVLPVQVRPPPWTELPESVVLGILPVASMVPVLPSLVEAVFLASPSSPSGGCSGMVAWAAQQVEPCFPMESLGFPASGIRRCDGRVVHISADGCILADRCPG